MPLPAWLAKKAVEKGAERFAPEAAAKLHDLGHRANRWAYLAPVAIVGLVVLLAASVAGTIAPPPAEAGTCGPNSPAPTNTALDQPVLDAINGMDTDGDGQNDYQQVAPLVDVAWSALAALDLRENGNDPTRSTLSGETIGTPNPDNAVTTTSKIDSITKAGEHLRAMASSVYGVTVTSATGGEDMKLAFLAYNRGYIYQRAGASPDRSPYVMNQFDAQHMNMVWPTDIPGETASGTDSNYGAFTVFVRLGGSSAGGNCMGLTGDANDLLTHPNVTFSRESQKDDLRSGAIDSRIIGVLLWMARDHTITITSLKTDHSPCAGGSGNELAGGGCAAGLSNHGYGRAADVSVVDGTAVNSGNAPAHAIADGIMADPAQMGLTELGQPWYNATAGKLYQFTAGHGDHIHIGIDLSEGPDPGPGNGSNIPGVIPAGPSAGGATVGPDGVPSGWREQTDEGSCTHWSWGVTDPNNRTIFYCAAKINGSGGSESLWNYTRQHERCHARAYEGLEPYDWTDERATDQCAAANGADTSWSPYV